MGRPTKLTPERHEAAIGYYKDGCTKRLVASLLQVDITSIQEWMRRGKSDITEGLNTIYSRFSLDVEQATAYFMQDQIKKVIDDPSWQAAKFILERRMRNDFGMNAHEKFEIKGETYAEKKHNVFKLMEANKISIESGHKLISIMQKDLEIEAMDKLRMAHEETQALTKEQTI